METENKVANELLQLSNSYWSVCALHAAVKLDLFTPLSACSFSSSKLAELVASDDRGLAMLLNALTAMGLLERREDSYSATDVSSRYLSRTSPHYLGHIILHHHYLMAPWAHLDEAVRSGRPIRQQYAHGDEAAMLESFEMGMYDLAMHNAPRVVPHIDLGGRRHFLDLGGGPGTYAIQFCRHNSDLSAVVYDLPSTRPYAEKTIADSGLSDRITFKAGDFLRDRLGGPYDVAWLSQVLHGQGAAECSAILGKVKDALAPGGMILVQEFVLENTLDGPLFPALFSLNMLVNTERGQSYSWRQLEGLLTVAGFRDVRRLLLPLLNGAGILAAVAA